MLRRQSYIQPVFVAAVLLASLARAPSVSAYCYEGPMPYYDIPVYIVHDASTFATFPIAEAAQDLRVALDTWMEDSGGNIRPYYAGHVTSATLAPGQVHIRQTAQCDKCDSGGGYACEKTTYLPDPPPFGQLVRSSTIFLVTETCNSTWDYKRHTDSVFSLDALLTHELGHSWGIEDEYVDERGTPQCEGYFTLQSAMSGKCPNGRNITHRDVGSLAGLYGMRDKMYSAKVSTDGGLTWLAGPAEPTPLRAWVRQGSLGTSASLTSTESFAEAMFGQWVDGYPPYAHSWNGSTGGSFNMFAPVVSDSSQSFDVGGAARRDATNYAVATRIGETDEECSKGVSISRIAADVQTRAAKVDSTTYFASEADGVSMAYDPATGIYITAFADDNEDMAVQLTGSTTGNRVGYHAFPTLGKTFEAPSVACNEPAYTGTYNCMMAWKAAEGTDPVRFARFYIISDSNGTSAQFLAPDLHNYRTSQAPTITWQRSATYPFVISLKQDTSLYTWRYRASSNSFVDQRTAVSLPNDGVLAGTLGTQSGRLILRYVKL